MLKCATSRAIAIHTGLLAIGQGHAQPGPLRWLLNPSLSGPEATIVAPLDEGVGLLNHQLSPTVSRGAATRLPPMPGEFWRDLTFPDFHMHAFGVTFVLADSRSGMRKPVGWQTQPLGDRLIQCPQGDDIASRKGYLRCIRDAQRARRILPSPSVSRCNVRHWHRGCEVDPVHCGSFSRANHVITGSLRPIARQRVS
jgi:hypothetical protein